MSRSKFVIPFAGSACKKTRKEKGISRVFVARKLEMSPSQLLGYEHDKVAMKLELMERYASAINVKPIVILQVAHGSYVEFLRDKYAGNTSVMEDLDSINSLLGPGEPTKKGIAPSVTENEHGTTTILSSKAQPKSHPKSRRKANR